MGWLYKHEPIDDPVEYLIHRYTHDGERRRHQVLAAARVANTVYMAIKDTDKTTGTFFVSAAVILISNTRAHGFGYKDMDETMGPCACACPDRIMRLLSPVGDLPNPTHAADWRARVAAHKQAAAAVRAKRRSLQRGSIATLPHAVTFRDGTTAIAFRVRGFRGPTPIFEPLDRPGFACRLRAANLAAAVIAPPDGAAAVAGAGE
jgi:hypothetical protein